MMRTRFRFFLALAATLVLVGAVAAEGHKFTSQSTVTVSDLGPNGASGKVSSSRKFCEADRKVELRFQPEPGVFDVLDITTTDDSGRWEFSRQLPDTTFKLKALRKKVKREGHKHKCPAYKTGKLSF